MTLHTTDIAIIGGGLSGLTTAFLLAEADMEYCLLEAGPSPGGRIQSIRDPKSGTVLADLGPTWVWPQFQPPIMRWVEKLGLCLHAQYEDGLGIYEDGSKLAPQRLAFPGQQGIARVSGGPQEFVDRLSEKLKEGSLRLNSAVTQISRDHEQYHLTLNNDPHAIIRAKRVVVACPLRIAAKIEGLAQLVPDQTSHILRSTPTWMAVHAKVAIVYDRAFWREDGLSGRVASQAGPLVEMHDISGENGTPAALFGFCGIPPHQREPGLLRTQVLDQLVRCFGEKAGKPITLEIKDWATQKHICTDADLSGAMSHPERLPSLIRDGYQNGTLFFSTSETSGLDPGLISGALEAGEDVALRLIKS